MNTEFNIFQNNDGTYTVWIKDTVFKLTQEEVNRLSVMFDRNKKK